MTAVNCAGCGIDDVCLCHVQVSWEFWTNSNDECGLLCDKQKKFIKVITCSSRDIAWHHSSIIIMCLLTVCEAVVQDQLRELQLCCQQSSAMRCLGRLLKANVDWSTRVTAKFA
eukprot:GHUV01056994.1.p1 GENE.GHUV01056994.1~~GHUV01056994.1.p1  ORF type:complete len:114 (-),score=8.65 GHUV01056994.1:387-728(-)